MCCQPCWIDAHRDSCYAFLADEDYDGREGAAPPTYGPHRHVNDSYWKQQPLLAAAGFPTLFEMWGAELKQHLADDDAAAVLPAHRL